MNAKNHHDLQELLLQLLQSFAAALQPFAVVVESHFVVVATVLAVIEAVLAVVVVAAARWQHPSQVLPDTVEANLHHLINGHNCHGRCFLNFEAAFDAGFDEDDCLKSCNGDRYVDDGSCVDVEGHVG